MEDTEDTWQKVWDWARGLWGEDPEYSFNAFFRRVARQVAKNEGWGELGSSDVWHASFSCVQRAMLSGKVDSSEALMRFVCGYHGVY